MLTILCVDCRICCIFSLDRPAGVDEVKGAIEVGEELLEVDSPALVVSLVRWRPTQQPEWYLSRRDPISDITELRSDTIGAPIRYHRNSNQIPSELQSVIP